MISNKISAIVDAEIKYYVANKKLNLVDTLDVYKADKDTDHVIISTSTAYDDLANNIISAIVDENRKHKYHIVDMIISRKPKVWYL
ncbi:MAG: hypothetical protein ACRCSG_03785 [Cellulosilyticaceae bacterium]